MRTTQKTILRQDGDGFNVCVCVALIFGVLALAAVGFARPALAQEAALTTATVVVLKNFPPQYMTRNGKPEGLAVDYIEAIARVAGFKIHYMTVDSWGDGYEAIASGTADVFPAVGISEKKRSFLDFTAPFDTMGMSLFVRAGTTPTVTSLDDLNGRILGVHVSDQLTRQFKQGRAITMKVFNTYDELFLALLSGTVDAVSAPKRTLLIIARGARLDNQMELPGIPLWEAKTGMAVRQGNSAWLERLETAARKVKLSPRYSEILKKWEGEPTPLWTIKRLLVVVGVGILFVFVAILLWRNRYINSVNQTLRASKKALLDATGHLQSLVDEKTEQNKVLGKISSNVMLAEILSDICLMSERLEPGSVCSIFLLDAAEHRLRYGAAPNLPGYFIDAINGVEIGPTVGACGAAAYSDDVVIVEDISAHPNWDTFRDLAADAGLWACWCAPIHSSDNKVLGVFAVYYKAPRAPTADDLDFINSQSSLASIAIERDQAITLMMQQEEVLTSARNAAAESMMQATRALADLDEQKFILQAHSIVAATDLEGRITYANDKFLELSQYSREELVGKTFRKVNSGYHPAAFFKDLWETISSGQVWSGEIRNRAKDGSYYWVATTIVPMFDEDGAITKYVTAKSNITASKQTEQKLRRAAKMEAIGQLSGGISHDFNNILGIVQGNLELLQRLVVNDPGALKRVETALRGIRRGTELTKKLLGFSRGESRGSSLLTVNTLIEEMRDLITKSLTVSVTIDHHLADNLWPVRIDSGDLEDAILNLSLNARDAMPDGGALTIETANKVVDDTFVQQNPASYAGDFVMLSVRDTGTGLSPGTQEKIFEPFFSTKEEGQGTGLGLSMVYGFVQRSSGFITTNSALGKGTTFCIYLPRAHEGIDEIHASNSVAKTDLNGHETILIVDDEAALVDVAVDYLEDLGYKTFTANNAIAALDILLAQPGIDMLFSDVVMPGGMDGYRLGKEALKDHPGLRVLLTSGFVKRRAVAADDDIAVPDTPVSSLLSKPYTQTELGMAIRRTFNEKG